MSMFGRKNKERKKERKNDPDRGLKFGKSLLADADIIEGMPPANETQVIKDLIRDAHILKVDGKKTIQEIMSEDKELFPKGMPKNETEVDKDTIKQFFINHLLHKMPPEKKEGAANYLMRHFHQAGIPHFLDTPLIIPVQKAFPLDHPLGITIPPTWTEKSTEISTTENGLSINQRVVQSAAEVLDPEARDFKAQKKLAKAVTKYVETKEVNGKTEEREHFLISGKNKSGFYTAKATMNIDFVNSEISALPNLTVSNNEIAYGSDAIKKIMPKKSLAIEISPANKFRKLVYEYDLLQALLISNKSTGTDISAEKISRIRTKMQEIKKELDPIEKENSAILRGLREEKGAILYADDIKAYLRISAQEIAYEVEEEQLQEAKEAKVDSLKVNPLTTNEVLFHLQDNQNRLQRKIDNLSKYNRTPEGMMDRNLEKNLLNFDSLKEALEVLKEEVKFTKAKLESKPSDAKEAKREKETSIDEQENNTPLEHKSGTREEKTKSGLLEAKEARATKLTGLESELSMLYKLKVLDMGKITELEREIRQLKNENTLFTMEDELSLISSRISATEKYYKLSDAAKQQYDAAKEADSITPELRQNITAATNELIEAKQELRRVGGNPTVAMDTREAKDGKDYLSLMTKQREEKKLGIITLKQKIEKELTPKAESKATSVISEPVPVSSSSSLSSSMAEQQGAPERKGGPDTQSPAPLEQKTQLKESTSIASKPSLPELEEKLAILSLKIKAEESYYTGYKDYTIFQDSNGEPNTEQATKNYETALKTLKNDYRIKNYEQDILGNYSPIKDKNIARIASMKAEQEKLIEQIDVAKAKEQSAEPQSSAPSESKEAKIAQPKEYTSIVSDAELLNFSTKLATPTDLWRAIDPHERQKFTINTIDKATGKPTKEVDAIKLLNSVDEEGKKLFLTGKIETEKDVRVFLENYIVDKLPKERQSAAIDHLLLTFHQEGYLHPVSEANILKSSERLGEGQDNPQIAESTQYRNLSITTSDTGFTVKEYFEVRAINDPSNQLGMLNEADEDFNGKIKPDPGKNFVFAATATIKVDLLKGTRSVVEGSNKAFYGNEAFREHFQSKKEKKIDKNEAGKAKTTLNIGNKVLTKVKAKLGIGKMVMKPLEGFVRPSAQKTVAPKAETKASVRSDSLSSSTAENKLTPEVVVHPGSSSSSSSSSPMFDQKLETTPVKRKGESDAQSPGPLSSNMRAAQSSSSSSSSVVEQKRTPSLEMIEAELLDQLIEQKQELDLARNNLRDLGKKLDIGYANAEFLKKPEDIKQSNEALGKLQEEIIALQQTIDGREADYRKTEARYQEAKSAFQKTQNPVQDQKDLLAILQERLKAVSEDKTSKMTHADFQTTQAIERKIQELKGVRPKESKLTIKPLAEIALLSAKINYINLNAQLTELYQKSENKESKEIGDLISQVSGARTVLRKSGVDPTELFARSKNNLASMEGELKRLQDKSSWSDTSTRQKDTPLEVDKIESKGSHSHVTNLLGGRKHEVTSKDFDEERAPTSTARASTTPTATPSGPPVARIPGLKHDGDE